MAACDRTDICSMLRAAKAAMAKAYAPYSNFPVGAAIRTEDGRIFAGCNIEIASYPEGWCAETTALGHYVMGGGGKIAEIAVIAERMPRDARRAAAAASGSPNSPGRTPSSISATMTGIVETVHAWASMLPYGFAGRDAEMSDAADRRCAERLGGARARRRRWCWAPASAGWSTRSRTPSASPMRELPGFPARAASPAMPARSSPGGSPARRC